LAGKTHSEVGLPNSSARLTGNGATRWVRSVLAGVVVAALGTGLYAWYWGGQPGHPDFDQLYYAALSVRAGASPYTAVGPTGAFHWSTPFYYPMPAALLIVPLTVVSVRAAGAVFVAVSGFALGGALEMMGERWRYLLVASRGFVASAALGQWSIVLLAAAWLPILGIVGSTKPNVALVSAARWSRRDFVIPALGSLVLIVVSFAIRPSWIGEWRTALSDAPYQRSPLFYPGGFLALAALVRWRRPEARCLVAYALIPQTPGPYTDFMLFTIPCGTWETALLALLSYAPFPILNAMGPVNEHIELFPRYAGISNCVLVLPCVIMLLRRPNEGPAPTWVERRVASLPSWIRGSAVCRVPPHADRSVN
jgi:hypothetical protein